MTTATAQPTTVGDPAKRVTRALLGFGVIAGPVYVAVSLTQALTRDGFDLTRHAWSTLANGPLGWIQTTNLIVSGLMVIAFAAGLWRIFGKVTGILVGLYGLGMVGAGIFAADPVGVTEVSTHGVLHFALSGAGFLCLVAATFVLARRLPGRWPAFTRLTGIVFLATFACIATGSIWAVIPFTVAIVLMWGWMSALSVHLYKR